MSAFHVIGIDFQLRLGIGCCAAIEQHGLDRLLGINALRIAGNIYLAQEAARGFAGQHAAHNLV